MKIEHKLLHDGRHVAKKSFFTEKLTRMREPSRELPYDPERDE